MKTRPGVSWLLVLAVTPHSAFAGADPSEYRLVVHADNPVTEITCEDAAKLFLKKITKWDDCVAVEPVDQDADSAARIRFSDAVHEKSVEQIKRYWQTQIFSGRAIPPPELADDHDVLAYVAGERGAIGYVSSAAGADDFPAVKLVGACAETSSRTVPVRPCSQSAAARQGVDLGGLVPVPPLPAPPVSTRALMRPPPPASPPSPAPPPPSGSQDLSARALETRRPRTLTPADAQVTLILDVSGSMAGVVDGFRKIDVARKVVDDLLDYWDPSVHLGLTVYGHGSQVDRCKDVQQLIAVGPPDAGAIADAVSRLEPTGRTPLTLAVQESAKALRADFPGEPARVVLVTDGLETCGGDPCTLGASLATIGVDLTAYVVGFDLRGGDRLPLRCLAESTGGGFGLADDEDSLRRELAAAFEKATEGRLRFPFHGAPVRRSPRRVVEAPKPPRLAYVPAGSFEMGSPAGEAGRDDDETRHRVTVTRGFFVTETEVTQGEWRDFEGGRPASFEECGPRCPVESVNWYEALYFANRLSELAGLESCYELGGCEGTPGVGCVAGEPQCLGDFVCAKVRFRGFGCPGFRLPTEAEWELAARSSTTTAFATGEELATSAGRFGAVAPASGPVAAGSFAATPGGLYDVHGNVREWVWDTLAPYPPMKVEDPVAGLDATATSARVTRGGSWSDEAAACRSAARDGADPRLRSSSVGFRLVKTE